ncbi:molecular chaperone DnaK [Candidatus Gracilibacteria bacterium]|nr:molecular chaperone DnaK [Candidatus Gracilibacteria bacterium]NJP17863.1 molecular chaperone DnaK [Hydrococcus sp. CRU_1_1]
MGRVVGIDLGTTNSVVAVMEGGKPLVIPNSEGMRTTPSVVGFTKDEELVVGQMARRQTVLNPQNTFFAIKRFMGRKYAELQPESKQVPYTIRRDDIGNIKIRCPRLKKEFAPEEISAMILRKLAEEASRFLGEEVTGAVITVPAYFNDSQRQATRDAGRIAGLEVLRIINEPTAASLAYGLDQERSQKILVFDLGGGTFDVSILEVGDGVFEVKATSGDTQLGGVDFDKRIVDWLAEQFLETEKIDLRRHDRQALQRLMEAAEKAKIELSGVSVTDINLPFIAVGEDGPKHIETRLTRPKFEELCGDLITRLRRPLKRALSDAGMSPVQIDEVVLVGGASRMPMVQDLVRSFIDKDPNQTVNPDEVVAVGAAIQAGILQGEVKDILLLDVTPLSIGLETIGGVMKKLLPRNTTIPVRRSDIFSTSENNQTQVEIHILQGEREMVAGNKSLGRFKLTGIPPAPRGVPQVQVAFDIDANGILQVTARDKMTGREQSITVQGASTLSESEINRMMRDATEFAQEDRERRERVEKRNRGRALVDRAQRQVKEATLDFGTQFTSSYRRQIESLSTEILDSLEKDDERRLDRAQADLDDVLYELKREVKLQYESEEDEGIISSVKNFFTGDKEEDLPYTPRRYGGDRDSYRDNYRDSYRENSRDSYRDNYRDSYQENSRDNYRSSAYDRYDNSDDAYSNRGRSSGSRSRNVPPESDRSYSRSRRNLPRENDWDEDDDDWF